MRWIQTVPSLIGSSAYGFLTLGWCESWFSRSCDLSFDLLLGCFLWYDSLSWCWAGAERCFCPTIGECTCSEHIEGRPGSAMRLREWNSLDLRWVYRGITHYKSRSICSFLAWYLFFFLCLSWTKLCLWYNKMKSIKV